MPTIEENKRLWEVEYDWPRRGDEWSEGWGEPRLQWLTSILPRIQAFVPTGTILEIGPGFGRWTEFLKDLCEQLLVVDVSDKCIRACRERFSSCSHITCFLNDGKSLDMIQDESIDFVFSFDSLVHAEADVIEAYLGQLAKKLKPNGVGFIHHSNAGRYRRYFSLVDRIPWGKWFLYKRGLISLDHLRARSMTAGKFEAFAEGAALQCIAQEIVNWGGTRRLIDCFSTFTRKGSAWARPNRIVSNKRFMTEAKRARKMSDLYGFFKEAKEAL